MKLKRGLIMMVWAALLCWQVTAHANSGIYLTLLTGWANHSGLPSQSAAGASSVDHRNLPVGRVAVGYLHDFDPLFGLGFEAARGWYNKSTYHFSSGSPITVDSTTSEFLAVFMWHIRQYDLFTKLGGIRHAAKTKKATGDVNNVRIQLEAAAGMNYNLSRHCALTLQYARTLGQTITNLENAGWSAPSLNEILAGVRITFG